MKRSGSINFPAVIDRIEEGSAVIYLGDDEQCRISLPLKFLPRGIRAGSSLKITIAEDIAATDELKRKVVKLQQELLKRHR